MLGWGQAGPMRAGLGSTHSRFIMCLKLCILHQVILDKTNVKTFSLALCLVKSSKPKLIWSFALD